MLNLKLSLAKCKKNFVYKKKEPKKNYLYSNSVTSKVCITIALLLHCNSLNYKDAENKSNDLSLPLPTRVILSLLFV